MAAATVNELLSKRAGLIAQARGLMDRAKAAGRQPTAEESHNFDRLHDDAADLKARADAMSSKSRGRVVADKPGRAANAMALAEERMAAVRSQPEYRRAFGSYLHHGGVSADLQADVADKGGYMVPTEFAAEIIKSLDNTFWFRRLANVLPSIKGDSISFPRRTARMQSFAWGAELANTNALKDAQLAVGQTVLTPGWMCGEIDVSNSLFASGVVDVEAFVQGEITYAAGETEENAFMTGDGVRKPLGVFTPHPDGIPASRDAVGTISTDTLYDAKFSLREPYLRSDKLAWLAGRQFIKQVAKLKDSNNNPLWVVSVRDGEPDRLLGVPTTLSEYAPAGTGTNGALASGDYAAVLGDFRNYDILDGDGMSVQRLDQLEARRNMTAFIIRRRVTGWPRHGEAFARVKVA